MCKRILHFEGKDEPAVKRLKHACMLTRTQHVSSKLGVIGPLDKSALDECVNILFQHCDCPPDVIAIIGDYWLGETYEQCQKCHEDIELQFNLSFQDTQTYNNLHIAKPKHCDGVICSSGALCAHCYSRCDFHCSVINCPNRYCKDCKHNDMVTCTNCSVCCCFIDFCFDSVRY